MHVWLWHLPSDCILYAPGMPSSCILFACCTSYAGQACNRRAAFLCELFLFPFFVRADCLRLRHVYAYAFGKVFATHTNGMRILMHNVCVRITCIILCILSLNLRFVCIFFTLPRTGVCLRSCLASIFSTCIQHACKRHTKARRMQLALACLVLPPLPADPSGPFSRACHPVSPAPSRVCRAYFVDSLPFWLVLGLR